VWGEVETPIWRDPIVPKKNVEETEESKDDKTQKRNKAVKGKIRPNPPRCKENHVRCPLPTQRK